jgi:hypothetical protein
MNKRPLSIILISWLFISVGSIALVYHLLPQHIGELKGQGLVWVCLVRLLAIVSGVFMLRGLNWARWLLVAWIGFHVILSAFHSAFEVVVHGLLFAVIIYFLFRAQAAAYFRPVQAPAPEALKTDERQA